MRTILYDALYKSGKQISLSGAPSALGAVNEKNVNGSIHRGKPGPIPFAEGNSAFGTGTPRPIINSINYTRPESQLYTKAVCVVGSFSITSNQSCYAA
ncbi:MAG: hypothetical protein V4590_14525 [Bacteroidota bacterium]